MKLSSIEGKHTVETLMKELDLTRGSTLNLLSKLKKQGFVSASGGGRQKRIYTITKLPQQKTNGFYDVVNKYASEKLVPRFNHYVVGRYTVERAIVEGLLIGDARTKAATMHLFNQVSNWKRLIYLAKCYAVLKELYDLYRIARKKMRCRRMPKKYDKH